MPKAGPCSAAHIRCWAATEAIPAYRKVIELRPDDAQGHADLADALGSAAGKKLDGEPEQLIAKALKLDPDNIKALSLDGTIAFNQAKARAGGQAVGEGASPASSRAASWPGSCRVRWTKHASAPAFRLWRRPPQPVAAPSLADLAKGAPGRRGHRAQRQGAGHRRPAGHGGAGRRQHLGPGHARQVAAGQGLARRHLVRLRTPDLGQPGTAGHPAQALKDLPLKFTLDDSLSMSPQIDLSTAARWWSGRASARPAPRCRSRAICRGRWPRLRWAPGTWQLVAKWCVDVRDKVVGPRGCGGRPQPDVAIARMTR